MKWQPHEAKTQDATASKLKRLLGARGSLAIDYCKKPTGAIVAENDDKQIILCRLPANYAVGKREADAVLDKFIDDQKITPYTVKETTKILNECA